MAITAILPSQVLADGASDGDLLTVQADGSVAFDSSRRRRNWRQHWQ